MCPHTVIYVSSYFERGQRNKASTAGDKCGLRTRQRLTVYVNATLALPLLSQLHPQQPPSPQRCYPLVEFCVVHGGAVVESLEGDPLSEDLNGVTRSCSY